MLATLNVSCHVMSNRIMHPQHNSKMKIAQKNKIKQQGNKKKKLMKPKKENILIVAQEIKFARLLSGNEKKTRDRALKTLKKWLYSCFAKGYEFKEDDFARIWKGLFYAVWMSDKPLVQEELCENIAGILDQFSSDQYRHALLMVKVGLKAVATEWHGIDHHRMDKCLMLVRRYLRGSLRCVARCGWSEESCRQYAQMLSGTDGILAVKTPLYARNATSMILHIIDCYLEEIAKVSEGDIAPNSLAELLRPMCVYMCGGSTPAVCAACRRLLTALVRQSELGLQYQDRARAWEKMGCPEGGPDALQLISDDEDEELADEGSDDDDSREKNLDPRAGRVDVVLAPLPVPSERLASMLGELIATTSSKAHTRAKICMQRFQQLAKQEYPLAVTPDQLPVTTVVKPKLGRAARSLLTLEKTLVPASDELALRGLSRKHRKRLLAKSRAGQSIVDDVAALAASHNNAAGDWQVEEAVEIKNKKIKTQDTSNKENVNKKNKKRKAETLNGDSPTKKKRVEVTLSENDNKTQKQKNKKQAKSETKFNGIQKSDIKTGLQKTQSNIQKSETKQNSVQKPKNAPAVIKEKPKKETEKPKQKKTETESKQNGDVKIKSSPTVVAKKVKIYQKQLSSKEKKDINSLDTPKKVKFVLKNNSMQGAIDYYKSVRQSPKIPFDSSRKPSKTNLKPSTPSPINPFFKKKWKLTN